MNQDDNIQNGPDHYSLAAAGDVRAPSSPSRFKQAALTIGQLSQAPSIATSGNLSRAYTSPLSPSTSRALPALITSEASSPDLSVTPLSYTRPELLTFSSTNAAQVSFASALHTRQPCHLNLVPSCFLCFLYSLYLVIGSHNCQYANCL